MTAALFLLAAAQWADVRVGDEITLDGAEGRHAVTVVRVVPGETVLIGDGEGRRATVEVTHALRDVLVGTVTEIQAEPPAELRLVMVQALAKAGRDEQAVEAATELGVDTVIPWQASRCVVAWRGERAVKGHAKWRNVVAAATKQSRRLRTPAVEPVLDTTALLERTASSDLTLVLHESAGRSITEVPVPSSGEVVVVVGPEGGITDEELAELERGGAVVVSMGTSVLRSSTAGPAALAVLSAATRWAAQPRLKP